MIRRLCLIRSRSGKLLPDLVKCPTR